MSQVGTTRQTYFYKSCTYTKWALGYVRCSAVTSLLMSPLIPSTLRLRTPVLGYETESTVELKGFKERELVLGFKRKILLANLKRSKEPAREDEHTYSHWKNESGSRTL